jgi:hypothetical protein
LRKQAHWLASKRLLINKEKLVMNYDEKIIYNFVMESNAIEQIFREPAQEEINEFVRFMGLSKITIEELEKFVSVYEPKARLRDQYGLNVRVGRYYPPFGSPEIRENLKSLLDTDYDPYAMHLHYEHLHPFTDCNGRSGRALWAWQMQNIEGGFLLNFYYQALQAFHMRK